MSTARERQARADAIDAEYEALIIDETFLSQIEQASEDALTDSNSASVLRVRAFIRLASRAENPNSIMRQWAELWLQAADGLASESKKILEGRARREAAIALAESEATSEVVAAQTDALDSSSDAIILETSASE